MNSADFTSLLQYPENIDAKKTQALNEVISEFPYFQSARAIQLKGLNKTNSFKYNQTLKKTAAYTVDRKVLFDFITSPIFITKDDDAIKKHKVVKIETDGKEPLYLIDGKEITREEMNNINPETIDKVEVLKGDDATEKYGDKGKYGVVIITTKNKN